MRLRWRPVCVLVLLLPCAARGAPDANRSGELERRRTAGEARRACDQGVEAACTALADLHARGQGVPADVQRALALRQRACDLGHGGGCRRFAESLRNAPFDLDVRVRDLVLRGLVGTPRGFIALAEAEDGLPVILTPGQRLRDAVVTGIDANEVTFRQALDDPLLAVRARERRMALYHEVSDASAAGSGAAPRASRGAPVTLKTTGRLGDILDALVRAGGAVAEVEAGLDAPATVDVVDAPWDDVLHDLAKRHGLSYIHAGRMVRVGRSLAPHAEETYTGTPIELDFVRVSLDELLRLFADISGLNVVAPLDRLDPVSIRVIERPWDEVLVLILEACRLEYRLDGNVVNIVVSGRRRPDARAAWRGDRTTAAVRNVALGPLFLLLGRGAGVDVVADEEVQGRDTFLLSEVPADQILDLILDRHGLALRDEGGTLHAVPRAEAGADRDAATASAFARAFATPPGERAATASSPPEAGDQIERRLETLRKVLPDGPEPQTGVAEIRSLWAASAGNLPPLDLSVGSPDTEAAAPNVPVRVAASLPLPQVTAFLEQLASSVRLVEVASLKLSRAEGGRVRFQAVLRMRYWPPSEATPAEILSEKADAIVSRNDGALLFAFDVHRAAALVRLAFDEVTFEDDGEPSRASVRGTVGWPDGIAEVERAFTGTGRFVVEKRDSAAEAACTTFELALRTAPFAPAAGIPSRPPGAAGFAAPDTLCRADRDATVSRSVQARGGGTLTIRLHDADLADVFRVLHAQTGQAFVVDEDVVGRVDVDLRGVSLDRALKALCTTGLRTMRVGVVLYVSRHRRPLPAPSPALDTLLGRIQRHAVTLDAKRRPLEELLTDLPFYAGGPVTVPAAPPGRVSVMALAVPWHELYPALLRIAGRRPRVQDGGLVVEGAAGPLRRIEPAHEVGAPSAAVVSMQALRLAGIASADGGRIALAYDPTGRLGLYRKGDALADGRVADVGDDFVTVEGPGTGSGGPLALRHALPGNAPPITLGAETTRIVGPLLPDGTPDYAAAINALLGEAVTPENNAAPALSEAMGRLVGRPADAVFVQERQRASRRPWREAEYPLVAEWLRVNEEPLRRIEEAVGKPRRFVPLVEGRTIADALIPSLLAFRNVANAFLARALLRSGNGDGVGASADVVAIHRLADLVAQGPWLIDGIVATALRDIGSAPVPMLAARLEPGPARALASALQPPAAWRSLGDRIDTTERLNGLAVLLWLRRLGAEQGSAAWKTYFDPFGERPSSPFYETPVDAYDWDAALRQANRSYDLMVSALETASPDEQDRREALIHQDLDRLRVELEAALGPVAGARAFAHREWWTERPEAAETVRLPRGPGQQALLGRLLAATVVQPSMPRAQVSDNEALARLRVGVAALSLAAHRGETGLYPATAGDVAFSGIREGYRFRYEPDPARARFAYTAVPERPDRSGIRTFCADDTGRSVAAPPGPEPVVVDGRCHDREEENARSQAAELVEKAEAKVRETEVVAQALGDFQRRVAEIERKHETLSRLLPATPEVPAFVDQLRDAAAGSGVRIAWGGDSRSESVEDHVRIEVPIRLAGAPDAIEALLPRIRRMVRLARIAGRAAADGGADLRLHVFALQPTPQSPPGCGTLERGADLLACCRDTRADLAPEVRERLGAACARLEHLRAIVIQMDALDAKYVELGRRLDTIERLHALP